MLECLKGRIRAGAGAVWRWLVRWTGAGWVWRRVTWCAGRATERLAEELQTVGLILLGTFITAGLSLFVDTPQDKDVVWTLLKRWGFAAVAVFTTWAVGYVSMFSERRRVDRAEQRADRAEWMANELFPQMMELLKQIARNTAPQEPDQSTSGPIDESVRLDD